MWSAGSKQRGVLLKNYFESANGVRCSSGFGTGDEVCGQSSDGLRLCWGVSASSCKYRLLESLDSQHLTVAGSQIAKKSMQIQERVTMALTTAIRLLFSTSDFLFDFSLVRSSRTYSCHDETVIRHAAN